MPGGLVDVLSPNVRQWVDEAAPPQREQISGAELPVAETPFWSAGNKFSLNPGGSYQFSLRLLSLAALFAAPLEERLEDSRAFLCGYARARVAELEHETGRRRVRANRDNASSRRELDCIR